MFGDFVQQTEPKSKQKIGNDLISLLKKHTALEEFRLYPGLRQALPDGDNVADKALRQHRRIERRIDQLEDTDVSSKRYERLMFSIMQITTEHIAEEERAIWRVVELAGVAAGLHFTYFRAGPEDYGPYHGEKQPFAPETSPVADMSRVG